MSAEVGTLLGIPLSAADVTLPLLDERHTGDSLHGMDVDSVFREVLRSSADLREAFVMRFGSRAERIVRRSEWLEEFSEIPAVVTEALDFATFARLWHAHPGPHQSRRFNLSSRPEPAGYPHHLLAKASASLWKYGFARDWNGVVLFLSSLARYDFGLDDFRVTLDTAVGWNERGRTTFTRIDLDGAFGLLIHFRGAHVATIGFSLASGRRVLLQQAQAASPRGNRWLYRLGGATLLEHAASTLHRAFAPDFKLCVAHGRDLAERISRAYTDGGAPPPNRSVLEYIERTYAEPLAGYRRTRPIVIGQSRFHPLRPR